MNQNNCSFKYRSAECDAQNDVAYYMSIYKSKEHVIVQKAIKIATNLNINDMCLFEKNPHKWHNGIYQSYGRMSAWW